MKTIPVEEYEPFGDEWKKEISKMTKPMLVNLLRQKLIDLQNFKYRPKKLIDDNMKLTTEQFLREKLESEISSFGDGTTEFHTRDIEHLLKCLEEKDNEIHELKSDVDFWKNKSFTLQQENLKHTL